jgi:hypothetical protein
VRAGLPVHNDRPLAGLHSQQIILRGDTKAVQGKGQWVFHPALRGQFIQNGVVEVILPPALQFRRVSLAGQLIGGESDEMLLHHLMETAALFLVMLAFQHGFGFQGGPAKRSM